MSRNARLHWEGFTAAGNGELRATIRVEGDMDTSVSVKATLSGRICEMQSRDCVTGTGSPALDAAIVTLVRDRLEQARDAQAYAEELRSYNRRLRRS